MNEWAQTYSINNWTEEGDENLINTSYSSMGYTSLKLPLNTYINSLLHKLNNDHIL
jgi:hypothetical protein